MHSSESSNAEIGFRDQEKPGGRYKAQETRHKQGSGGQATKKIQAAKIEDYSLLVKTTSGEPIV